MVNVFAAGIGLLGALIGSFLNVVIHRVPAGASVVKPPSACPSCGAVIRARDNVPVLSWLFLRGRCRDCSARISARYPLVELSTAGAFALVTLASLSPLSVASAPIDTVAAAFALVGQLYLAAVSIALTLIDLETRTLPNRIVLPALPVLLGTLGASSALSGEWDAVARGLIGSAALFLFYYLLAVATHGGMGFGDVKLAAVLGLAMAWTGWPALAVGSLAAFVLGGAFGVLLLLSRRAGRGASIPFGPWMIGGAWTGVFFGDSIVAAYLRLFGLI